MLQTSTAYRTSTGHARKAPCTRLPYRRSFHVVHFKQGDKMEEGSIPQKAPPPTEVTPPTGEAAPTDTTPHHGHLDPVARSKDALSKLLGRHSETHSIDSATKSTTPRTQHKSKQPPAYEAPLNVPVFSRRREVS